MKVKIILSLLLFGSIACSKKSTTMKTGYYSVSESKIYINGDTLISNFKALGSYTVMEYKKGEYTFKSSNNNKTIGLVFNIKLLKSYDYDSPNYSKVYYKINNFNITPTELSLTRTEIHDSLVSKIHFKYIE
ncbi:MAG: hypothetical protein R2779_00385 [Crocinitomicaceae bacterium]